MAAGFGKRMQPVSLDVPKPLIKVNGVRMIESVISALHENGIYEIYIVVGYKKEQFSWLPERYPGVVLIDNPYYDSCNNIASLYVAREYIENAIILDGDQIVCNANILTPEFERSGYNAVWTEHDTQEWLLTVKNGVVTECSRTGGTGGWQLFSVSRWSAEDGRKLKGHLETVFAREQNRQLYWDDVALFCYPEEYALGIREMQDHDVVEIDSFQELIAMDPTYESYLTGEENHG